VREFAASTGTAAAVLYVFFLIALFRESDGSGSSEVPASRLLAVVTKISIVVAGLGACYFTAPFLIYMSIRRGGQASQI